LNNELSGGATKLPAIDQKIVALRR
jgi:hypothetical protein